MYVICTYDVNEKRCSKIMKILRRYLFHIQKSVFEGTLTPKQFNLLKEELKKEVAESDSIIFYFSYNEKQIYKVDFNNENKSNLNIIID